MNTLFFRTILSITLILLSYVVHYGYLKYTKDNKIPYNRVVYYSNIAQIAVALIGLWFCIVDKEEYSSLSAVILAVVLLGIFATMWQRMIFDKFDEDEEVYPDLEMLVMLGNILSWLIVAFIIYTSNVGASYMDGIICTSAMIAIMFFQHYVLVKSRENNVIDNPGYLMIMSLWTILAYYVSKRKE
jgi:hypothetical protein